MPYTSVLSTECANLRFQLIPGHRLIKSGWFLPGKCVIKYRFGEVALSQAVGIFNLITYNEQWPVYFLPWEIWPSWDSAMDQEEWQERGSLWQASSDDWGVSLQTESVDQQGLGLLLSAADPPLGSLTSLWFTLHHCFGLFFFWDWLHRIAQAVLELIM